MTLSLRTRLLAGMALVALVLLAVALVITAATRDQLLSEVDSRLESLAPQFGESGPDDALPAPPTGGDRRPSAGWPRERASDAYEGVVDEDGVVRDLFRPNAGDQERGTPDIDATEFPPDGPTFLTTGSSGADTTYRVLAQPAGQVTSITAVPIDDVEATINRLVLVEILGSVAILATLGLVGWWVIRLGIRPIKEMTETATTIADGELGIRVDTSNPGTEAGQLALALNGMLGRIESEMGERQASEERLRRFVADASHELRTPITTIRGYAELYRHGGLSDDDVLTDAMRRTEQEAARMGRLVDDMLTLAKFDAERPIRHDLVDVGTIAADATADARAVQPERTITFSADGPTTTIGDADHLRQVVANVVGNALVHTPVDAPIAIEVDGSETAITVIVRDRGAGMSTESVDRLTERFYRADPGRSRDRGGSGLGLAIVDAAVAAHGGSVAITSTPGEGTTVTLTLVSPPA